MKPMPRPFKNMDIAWTGPYAWPSFESQTNLPPILEHPGIYLMAIEYKAGYMIYAAGITRRSIPARFREHTIKYLSVLRRQLCTHFIVELRLFAISRTKE